MLNEIYCPENVHKIKEFPPKKRHADRFDSVLFYHPTIGWSCDEFNLHDEMKTEGYTHWTQTPSAPVFIKPKHPTIVKKHGN